MYLSTLYIISYFFVKVKHYLRFLAVFRAFLKAEALGAPLDPGLRIVSPEPALLRLRLAWILAYSPCLGILFTFWLSLFLWLSVVRHQLSPVLSLTNPCSGTALQRFCRGFCLSAVIRQASCGFLRCAEFRLSCSVLHL